MNTRSIATSAGSYSRISVCTPSKIWRRRGGNSAPLVRMAPLATYLASPADQSMMPNPVAWEPGSMPRMRTLAATFVGGAQRRPPRALIGKFDPGME